MDTQKTLPTPTDAPTENNAADAPSLPLLLTIPAAARRLTISVRSIYRLIERNELAVVRVLPDTPRIRLADIDSLVARRIAESESVAH